MGETKTGYTRRGTANAVAKGVPRYEHHRHSKNPPEFGQADKNRKWTIHADPALHDFLRAHGYAEQVAHAFLDLLCTRIEAWFWEGYMLRYFNSYQVWVVSLEHTDAPHARPSPGLLQGYHLVLKPKTHKLGGATTVFGASQPSWEFEGLPQLHSQTAFRQRRDTTKNLTMKSDNYHRVTQDNPAWLLLDDPPPKKDGYYLYEDYFTLLSPTVTEGTPLEHQPTTSTWRFSWLPSRTSYDHARVPALASLPAGSFLLPTNEADGRSVDARLDSGNRPVQGVALVCEGLPPTLPLARRGSQEHAVHSPREGAAGVATRDFAAREAEGGGFDIGDRDECVVM